MQTFGCGLKNSFHLYLYRGVLLCLAIGYNSMDKSISFMVY
ncbi:MAG: hypothetical protein JWN76_1611 [Chitinophagaceae bacterium]|nr:hypothetical protein [Chitinophagaceae bacterium]